MEKSQTKKKIFSKNVFPCGFPISGDKKGGKKKVVLFFGKCEIDYKKRENFFYSFRELFNYFWWLVCRKR